VSYGKATSYLPVIDLLKGYLRIHDGDMHRDMREKLVGKLMVLDETLRSLQPAFLSLLGVPVQDDKWEQLDPVHRRQRTLEACRRLLLRESEVQPLVLVFEDLHWVDSESQAFLDGLVESLPTAKILLLVNYRPAYAHRWAMGTGHPVPALRVARPEDFDFLFRVGSTREDELNATGWDEDQRRSFLAMQFNAQDQVLPKEFFRTLISM